MHSAPVVFVGLLLQAVLDMAYTPCGRYLAVSLQNGTVEFYQTPYTGIPIDAQGPIPHYFFLAALNLFFECVRTPRLVPPQRQQ